MPLVPVWRIWIRSDFDFFCRIRTKRPDLDRQGGYGWKRADHGSAHNLTGLKDMKATEIFLIQKFTDSNTYFTKLRRLNSFILNRILIAQYSKLVAEIFLGLADKSEWTLKERFSCDCHFSNVLVWLSLCKCSRVTVAFQMFSCDCRFSNVVRISAYFVKIS